MPYLRDYKLLTCLHKGASSNIYQAVRISDNSPVIIKKSVRKLLNEKIYQRFQHEYTLGQKINSPYVIRYLELKQDPAYGIALIMEDDKAVELTSVIPPQGFSNREFLEIALQIVQGLQAIHAANIVHNDLKPNNIIIQPERHTVKIIDFNSASNLRQELQPTMSLGGTLAYISPEQTGRVNRNIDYRTDFYSLGATFYHLLCGQPPFTAEDALGLIHQHLAKQPRPPHHCKTTIALTISKIVMKLLEKAAENRYLSCEGILHDLNRCLLTLNDKDYSIPEFKLGEEDFSNKLTLSQHLYGRENEINTLMKVFERVSEGNRAALMVAGQPGVGKSMLIQEIQKNITLKNGFFLSGKFDQLNKNIAYSALSQAFDSLIKQLLAEDEASIAQWKSRLLTALGTHTQLIIKIVPTLALLIGEQPASTVSNINQAKNVLNLVFLEFVSAFANASHPLVIFLDDLQWADSATLELMVYLMQQHKLSHLLWIGAYRDTEVTNLHPAMQAIATLQAEEINVQMLTLAPLLLESLQQWIADSLHMSLADVSSLTELIQQKTAGNPFFVKLFLQSLYDQQLLTFSQQNHCWQWNIVNIRQHPATENVITLMTYQIQQLPTTTQDALSIASCLGHRLQLSILQAAIANSQQAVNLALQPALNSGIMIQTNGEIHFAHDRVQEAAYGLIPKTEKARMHFMIGKRLLTYLLPEETRLSRLLAHLSIEESWFFDIVGQFNRCLSLLIEPKERLEMAHLNLKASQKVKQATAYAAALDYLHTTQIWVDTQKLWETDYPLAFIIYKELAEVEYLNGHFEISEALIKDIQPHLRSVLDKVDIYHLLMVQKTVRGYYQAAITIAQHVLQLLGSELPLDNLTEFIEKKSIFLKQKLRDIPFSSLMNLPVVVDPMQQATFKILTSIIAPTYSSGATELMAAATLISIDLALTAGQATESCLSYAAYGLILCTKFKDYALGYQFGNFALELSEKLQSPVQYCRSALVTYGLIYHWSKPIRHLPNLLASVIEASLACGELEFGTYCALYKVLNCLYQNMPLIKVQQEALTLMQLAQSTKNQVVIDTLKATLLLISNLLGDTPNKWNFDTSTINETKFEEDCQQINGFYTLCTYHLFKVHIFYLYSDFELAFDYLKLARKHLDFVSNSFATVLINWYDSLTRLALYSTLSTEDQQTYLQQITENQQQLQKWQASCAENFSHKYFLVAAELARVKQDHSQAEALYDQAIELAGQYGFIEEQAIAAELAAKYWLARGKPLFAQSYLNIAFNNYRQWGAKRKLALFKAQYAELLNALSPPALSKLEVNQDTVLSGNSLRLLDLSSILKASHTISREIELPKLLRSIMQIIIENAGAQQGAVLLSETDETLYVQAEYASDGKMTTLQKIPLADWTQGAHSVVQYVKRLHQAVVVEDATAHEQFKLDPYVSRTKAKSILCVPLLKLTELKAILYLENNLMSFAFTPERVQTVLILTAQMAISLENARYFTEQLELTRQLAEQAVRIKIAEESLHAVTHDLQLALQASKAGTWNWQIGTDKVTWDQANCTLFGLTPNEFKGTYTAFLECAHPEDREQIDAAVKRCLEHGDPFDIEFRVIWPDDSPHMITTQGKVYHDDAGQPIKMAGVSFDITQRKQLEQERLQALIRAEEKERQRAREAEEHKKKLEEFIDTICHEIRNPLNGIYGGNSLLRETTQKLTELYNTSKEQLSSKTTKEFSSELGKLGEELEILEACANQGKIIVDDVLEYSKLESNKIVLKEIPFDLKKIILSTIKIFRAQIEQKKLEVSFELLHEPIFLKADSYRLTQVLINLLSNAIKFTPKGNVKITARTKPLSTTDTELQLTVKDTGIGMTETEQLHLFERFTQANRQTGAEYGGSGLGLSISKKLVEKMGGKITVFSEHGKGSEFSFTVKCINLSEEERTHLQHETQPFYVSEAITTPIHKTILIVEDNLINQKVLINYLKKESYFYEIANNGLEALEKFEKIKFDAILMDIEMPGMGGMEATEKIRILEKSLGYTTPIIGISGYVSEKDKQKALEAGMNDYLAKPYKQNDIYTVLAKHTGTKQNIEPFKIASSTQTEPSKKELTAKRKTESELEFTIDNANTANQIVKIAIDKTLGRWQSYGCATVPYDEQQRIVQLITSVFNDRRILTNEYQRLERTVSAAIYCQTPWYSCFNKIYVFETDKNGLIEKLQAIHEETIFVSPNPSMR